MSEMFQRKNTRSEIGFENRDPGFGNSREMVIFRLPVSLFFKQKFPVISSMVMLRHEVKNILWKFIFDPHAK